MSLALLLAIISEWPSESIFIILTLVEKVHYDTSDSCDDAEIVSKHYLFSRISILYTKVFDLFDSLEFLECQEYPDGTHYTSSVSIF
jgi:hypothetical protein